MPWRKLYILILAIMMTAAPSVSWAGVAGVSVESSSGFSCSPSASTPCANVDTNNITSLTGDFSGYPDGPYGNITTNCWAVFNTSGFEIFVPTATPSEFNSFLRAATGQDPNMVSMGIRAEPCCDPTKCVTHNGDCSSCINEGYLGSGNCCDWACPFTTDMLTGTGNPCCQATAAPLDPLLGGVCMDTCGNAVCDPWEDETLCCQDCGSFGDGICCSEAGETAFNTCFDCGAGCGDLFCCGAAGENAGNCADCAVCPDGTCTGGVENQSNTRHIP
jgi:hypothetical protein